MFALGGLGMTLVFPYLWGGLLSDKISSVKFALKLTKQCLVFRFLNVVQQVLKPDSWVSQDYVDDQSTKPCCLKQARGIIRVLRPEVIHREKKNPLSLASSESG